MSKQLSPEAQAALDGAKGSFIPTAFQALPNPWARISEIAAKVGVQPIQHGHPATITAMGADGNPYDLWEVIARVLDRLDRANP